MEELNLEERKLKEIEHSRQRRSILQGYERDADTHISEAVQLEGLVSDYDAFKKHYSNMKFYAIARSSESYYQEWLRQKCRGKKVLDYCCGNGENGIYAAKAGGEVTGIDISPEGIDNARLNADRAGVADRASFAVMDGENLNFADDSFDVIICYGALHHLEFPRAMSELSRVLKSDGSVICIEALRHNPLFHLYRKLTPHLRTDWEVEHILTVAHLDQAQPYFGQIDAKFFHLTALAAVPFRKTRVFKPLLGSLEAIDQLLLKSRALGKYGWMMVFTLETPKSGDILKGSD